MGIKVTKDKFVWKTLDYDDAKTAYKAGFPVFALYDDETESLISDAATISDHIIHGDVGLQVGFIPTETVEVIKLK